MQGRASERARTDFSVWTRHGRLKGCYRGIEVSASGVVVDRGRPISERDAGLYVDMEIRLPERLGPLRTLARPVWWFGTQQAFKFIDMTDVDRLTLAEHVDLMLKRRGRIQPGGA